MIKIRLERKLLYVFAVFIFSFFRKIIDILIINFYKFENRHLYPFLMNLGKIIGGAKIYVYQTITLNHKKEVGFFQIKLIHNKNPLKQKDKDYKIVLLLFFAAFFDFLAFIISIFYFPKFDDVPSIKVSRLGCFTIISSTFICTYALRFKLGKHHKFSMVILGICLIFAITLELLFKSKDTPMIKFIYAYILIIFCYINISFTDCI